MRLRAVADGRGVRRSLTRRRTVSEFARAASMRLRRNSRISDFSHLTRRAAAGLGHLDGQRPLVRIGSTRRRGLTAHQAIDRACVDQIVNFRGGFVSL
jgi:hypothetical protein